MCVGWGSLSQRSRHHQWELHTLSTARALAWPVLPGERGNGDTGFQEAIPVGERGQGAALQDQLGVSLHGFD